MARVNVRLAEPFWRAVGKRELIVELRSGSRIENLLEILKERYPAFEREIKVSPPTIFIGEDEVELQTVLEDGVQVHLVWPIAGGGCDI